MINEGIQFFTVYDTVNKRFIRGTDKQLVWTREPIKQILGTSDRYRIAEVEIRVKRLLPRNIEHSKLNIQ